MRTTVPLFANGGEALADALACLRGHEASFIQERATAKDRKVRAEQAITDPPVAGYYEGYVMEAGRIIMRLDQLGFRITAKPARPIPLRYPVTNPGIIPLENPLSINQELPMENAK